MIEGYNYYFANNGLVIAITYSCSMTKRPFKLRLKSSEEQYGVAAESLKTLKDLAKKKFKLPYAAESVLVQLEDGTIVDDEDYFSFVEQNTCFVISGRQEMSDEVDGGISYDGASSLDCLPCEPSTTDIYRLVSSLQNNITNVAKFTDEQLQAVVDAEERELKSRLPLTTDEIDGLQQACHTHIMERQKTSDAVELLKMYRDHVDSCQAPSNSPPEHKRARPSH